MRSLLYYCTIALYIPGNLESLLYHVPNIRRREPQVWQASVVNHLANEHTHILFY